MRPLVVSIPADIMLPSSDRKMSSRPSPRHCGDHPPSREMGTGPPRLGNGKTASSTSILPGSSTCRNQACACGWCRSRRGNRPTGRFGRRSLATRKSRQANAASVVYVFGRRVELASPIFAARLDRLDSGGRDRARGRAHAAAGRQSREGRPDASAVGRRPLSRASAGLLAFSSDSAAWIQRETAKERALSLRKSPGKR